MFKRKLKRILTCNYEQKVEQKVEFYITNFISLPLNVYVFLSDIWKTNSLSYTTKHLLYLTNSRAHAHTHTQTHITIDIAVLWKLLFLITFWLYSCCTQIKSIHFITFSKFMCKWESVCHEKNYIKEYLQLDVKVYLVQIVAFIISPKKIMYFFIKMFIESNVVLK